MTQRYRITNCSDKTKPIKVKSQTDGVTRWIPKGKMYACSAAEARQLLDGDDWKLWRPSRHVLKGGLKARAGWQFPGGQSDAHERLGVEPKDEDLRGPELRKPGAEKDEELPPRRTRGPARKKKQSKGRKPKGRSPDQAALQGLTQQGTA